jgi:hypothetical protein
MAIPLLPDWSPHWTEAPFKLNYFSSQSLSYITTDGQSASLSLNKAPIWGSWPDFHYCQTIAGLLIWGALSDERTGLSFTMYNELFLLQLSSLQPLWTDWVENTVSSSTSIAACVFVAAGKCLPSRCLETVLVYLLISWSLHSNGSTCYNNIFHT